MKAKLIGYEPVDYVKANGDQVRGCNLYFEVKMDNVFGSMGMNEYISAASPLFQRTISPNLNRLCDEGSGIFGTDIDIDYVKVKRGNREFSSISNITFSK